jgi:ABC-type protease/lipase transport system fused ATPase/permease subunit
VLITHRPALVQQVDKVLLLRDGAVELFGPREEVLKRLHPRRTAMVQPLRASVAAPTPSLAGNVRPLPAEQSV